MMKDGSQINFHFYAFWGPFQPNLINKQSPVVSLDVERCGKRMDEGNFLANLSQSLVPKRTNDEMEEGHLNERKVRKRRKD
jgi:hypothetical protein